MWHYYCMKHDISCTFHHTLKVDLSQRHESSVFIQHILTFYDWFKSSLSWVNESGVFIHLSYIFRACMKCEMKFHRTITISVTEMWKLTATHDCSCLVCLFTYMKDHVLRRNELWSCLLHETSILISHFIHWWLMAFRIFRVITFHR